MILLDSEFGRPGSNEARADESFISECVASDSKVGIGLSVDRRVQGIAERIYGKSKIDS